MMRNEGEWNVNFYNYLELCFYDKWNITFYIFMYCIRIIKK